MQNSWTRFSQAFELEEELKRTLNGEVRFDRGSRALYATDGSNYRQIPLAWWSRAMTQMSLQR